MKRQGTTIIGLIALMVMTFLVVSAFAKDDMPVYKGFYDGTSDAYKEQYEKHVGLKEGSGPFGKFYVPPKLHMYWSPDKHYEAANDKLDHTPFIEKNSKELCIRCHSGINKGTVHDWEGSAHANPKKTQYLAQKTKVMEDTLGRKIDSVQCFDCHVDKAKKMVRMPTATICGECHSEQMNEFMQERKHGRPNHVQSWEANVIVPWYIENARRGQMAGAVGCDMCHAVAEKCDGCHTRHTFSAEEARKPEACETCHMGPDHPNAETYSESKHGKIYEMEKESYNFKKPLYQVEAGKDYRSPTCQFCHMYQGNGKFTHNFVSKGRWRMGTVPPVEVAGKVKYESSLKAYPYDIKLIAPKVDIYSDANKAKRDKWNELCSKCHGPRFVDTYLDTLDDYMFAAFQLTDEAQKILDDLERDNMFYPSAKNSDIFPVGDKLAELLGPGILGEGVYKALKDTQGKLHIYGPILGVYSLFYQGKNNPLPIMNAYSKMWFWYKLQGYKGVAHANQDYAWWWGQSPMYQMLGEIQNESARLRREAAMESDISALKNHKKSSKKKK